MQILSRSAVLLAAMHATIVVGFIGSTANAAGNERGIAQPQRWPQAHSQGLVEPQREARVTEMMARMSLEEKIAQTIQGDIGSITPEDLRSYPLGSILAGGSSPPLNSDERAPAQAWIDTARAFRAVSLEARPGHVPIPIMFGIDSVHGNNNVVGATLFPHNVGLGATRDPQLIFRIGRATAAETAATGADWAFGPTLTTPQDDRWGRAFEGYSESPDVVRSFAPQMVRGLQGEAASSGSLQNGLVAASAKHFVADGGTTQGIDQGDADIAEDALIRIHSAGYPPAIEAGVMTVMVSYSSWQGVKNHGNRSLITGVLKGRMGFEGFVVGDWNGHAQVPGCTEESCAAAYNAGVDMLMAPASWKGLYKNTLAQVKSGEIPQARIDDAVRRILRVKFKLGLFEAARPWEGKKNVLGAPEHRAIAREAVRKSLVLLKNNGNVLPIKGNARVLVAGSGADDIGQASGGWSLSWQGTGNKNSDFPNGESIYAGLAAAVERAGGKTELQVDGHFKTKPDVAVVVFGETPYAEMQGDLRTLEYQAGDKRDLALLQRLKSAGVPVVSVFLSGRPLWVNPELNASDAFVAAWLPGSEGGGVADVLIADASGKAKYDFTGKLAYSWPRSAAQTVLNVGQSDYQPLFAFGYGLNYGDRNTVAKLPEASGVAAGDWNIDKYFVRGRTLPPWQFSLRPQSGVLAMQIVDAAGVQEAGRQLVWNGSGTASLVVVGGASTIDLRRQTNADLSLLMNYRVDEKPTAPVHLALKSAGHVTTLDLTSQLQSAPVGEWRTLKVKLASFVDAGADMAKIEEPVAIGTGGKLRLTINVLRLESDPQGAIKLPAVK
ncbi:MAG: glycoside hydrolase family 3 N-terminal domain-containing protein [Steroidobacteraceae bacterium]